MLLLLWGQAATADYDVLLDVSGSMAGFKNEASSWRAFLTALESGARNRYQFGDPGKFRRIAGASLADVPLNHDLTYLGETVANWVANSGSSAAIVVTDSRGDTSGATQSAKQQRAFEGLLSSKESPFSYVGVFAARLPFSGRVYKLTSNLSGNYSGPRAFLIYVLGRDGIRDEEIRDLLGAVKAALGGNDYAYFPIRAFDSSLFDGNLYEIDLRERPNRDVEVVIEDGVLVIRNYSFGDPLKFGLEADVLMSGNALALQDGSLEATIKFPRDPELVKPGGDANRGAMAQVTVPTVTFEPDKIEDFKIDFELRDIGFADISFWKRLNWTLSDSHTAEGRLEINLRLATHGLQISRPILTEWDYSGSADNLDQSDPDVQSRIFHLGKLIENLLPQDIPMQKLAEIPVRVEMRFPLWPILWPMLVFLSVIPMLWYLLFRDSKFVIEDDAGIWAEYAPYPFANVWHYNNDYRLAFCLRYLGWGFLVTYPDRRAPTRFVRSGGFIPIAGADGRQHEVLIRRAHRPVLTDEQHYDYG